MNLCGAINTDKSKIEKEGDELRLLEAAAVIGTQTRAQQHMQVNDETEGLLAPDHE